MAFMGIRMHQYGHPLHQKVLEYFIYIFKIDVKLSLKGFLASILDIVVRCVPSCYPDLAILTHLHGFDDHKDASIRLSTASEGA
jgi:hypothetical protein